MELRNATYIHPNMRGKTVGMSPKNAAAVALGRKGGYARAANLTKQERSEAARKAVTARWSKTDKALKELSERADRIDSGVTELVKANRKRRKKGLTP